MQGMGWCCLEELVWGDAAHPWVPPGTLHTRGPGAARAIFHVLGSAKFCRKLEFCRWHCNMLLALLGICEASVECCSACTRLTSGIP